MTVPNTTRRNRVANMLVQKAPKHTLTRNSRGRRNLLASQKQVGFSNGANNGMLGPTEVYGTNLANEMNSLRESRRSIQTSRGKYQNVRLNETQSKLFANLSAAYNEPGDMLRTLKQLEKRIYAMYGN